MNMHTEGGTVPPVAGRLRYRTPPEPGTILGPTPFTREYLVVIGQDNDLTILGYASTHELQAVRDRIADGHAPRSVAEITLPGAR